jgi:ABC-type sugar transport system ATPase subunit
VEARDRNVGIVFQSYALYPHMTVRNNILFPLRSVAPTIKVGADIKSP